MNWRCNVRRGVAFNKLIYIYPPLMEKMERKIQEQEKGMKFILINFTLTVIISVITAKLVAFCH